MANFDKPTKSMYFFAISARFRFRHTLHAHAEFDVFLHRQPRIERILLKHNTFTLAWPCYQLAAHLDRARCRFTETGNDVEQCCFAAAGRADHADELVLLHIQVDGIQREEFAVFLSNSCVTPEISIS